MFLVTKLRRKYNIYIYYSSRRRWCRLCRASHQSASDTRESRPARTAHHSHREFRSQRQRWPTADRRQEGPSAVWLTRIDAARRWRRRIGRQRVHREQDVLLGQSVCGGDQGHHSHVQEEVSECKSRAKAVDIESSLNHHLNFSDQVQITEGLSRSLCLFSVPATLNCHDILNFVSPCHPVLQHIRIIRDGTPNQFMVLLE